jgi:hypothetical protein
MRAQTIITIQCALGILACTTTKSIHNETGRSFRNHIYSEQIQLNAAGNAFDLIRSLRPHWLWGRGIKSIKYAEKSYAVVYVDGQRHGNMDSLSTIATDDISEIQFFSSREATFKFGLAHPGPAILIALH